MIRPSIRSLCGCLYTCVVGWSHSKCEPNENIIHIFLSANEFDFSMQCWCFCAHRFLLYWLISTKKTNKKKMETQRDQIVRVCMCVCVCECDTIWNFRMVAKKVENWLCTSRKVRFNAHHMPPQVEFSCCWAAISSNIRSFYLFRFARTNTMCVIYRTEIAVHW